MTQPVQPERSTAFAEIDINSLEKELVDQPLKVARYDMRLADKKNELALAENALDVTYAEISEAIRKDPLKFHIEQKVTEARMKELVIIQPAYKVALAKTNKIKHMVDLLKAAMNALEHRKESLKSLVVLWQHSYFNTVKVPDTSTNSDMKKRIQTAQKRAIRNPG